MATAANAATAAGGNGGGAAAPAAGSQEAINAAVDFDSAAASVLDLGASAEPGEKVADAAATEAGKTEVAGELKTDGEAAAGAAAATDQNQGKDNAGKPAIDEWAIDQAALDRALADPTHGAVTKTLHGQVTKLAAYRQHWETPEAARDARALVPGGLEELKGVVDAARTAKAENAEFTSGDPSRQATALGGLQAEAPEAFAAGLSPYIEIVAQKSPEAFQTALRPHVTRAVEATGLTEKFTALQKAAAGDDEKALQTAWNEFAGVMGQLGWKADGTGAAGAAGKAGAAAAAKPVDPELAAANAKLAEYQKKEQQATAQSYDAWSKPANTKIQEALRTEIGTFIDSYIPKTIPTAVREGLLELTRNNIESELLQQLLADTTHQERLVAAGKGWKDKPEETATQILNLQVGRAKRMIASIGAKHVSRYTTQTVAANDSRTAAEEASASHKDVTGGSPGRVKAPTLTPKDMKRGGAGTKLSDEQILDS